MKTFKNPKTKDLTDVAKGLAAFKVGEMTGRGIIGIAPIEPSQKNMAKGGLAVIAVAAAAAYNGKHKELIIPALVGVAAQQVGELVEMEAKKVVKVNSADGMPQKFINEALGIKRYSAVAANGANGALGCPCENNTYHPQLGMPQAIQTIEWEDTYTGEDENYSVDYGNAGA